MPTVNYIEPDGTLRSVDVAVGSSVKDGAIEHGVSGIVGLCGGAAMCGTCHVYVDEKDLHRLPTLDVIEDAMLSSTTSERRGNSRLGCQITMSDELDGLTVHLPPTQM